MLGSALVGSVRLGCTLASGAADSDNGTCRASIRPIEQYYEPLLFLCCAMSNTRARSLLDLHRRRASTYKSNGLECRSCLSHQPAMSRVSTKESVSNSVPFQAVEWAVVRGRCQYTLGCRCLVTHTRPHVVKVPRSFEARKMNSSALRRH